VVIEVIAIEVGRYFDGQLKTTQSAWCDNTSVFECGFIAQFAVLECFTDAEAKRLVDVTQIELLYRVGLSS